jgi:hypothetical protein
VIAQVLPNALNVENSTTDIDIHFKFGNNIVMQNSLQNIVIGKDLSQTMVSLFIKLFIVLLN